MCAEKTRRLEVSRDDDFSPRVQLSGRKITNVPFWRSDVGRVTFSARQLPSSCHPRPVQQRVASRCATPISGFWIPNTPTPGFPTPKGMTTPCSFPRRFASTVGA